MTHLPNKISWDSLFQSLSENKSLKLPYGECNLIHITSNKIRCLLKTRKYLQCLVCENIDCITIGEKYFHKPGKKTIDFDHVVRDLDAGQKKEMNYFIQTFIRTIKEFSKTTKYSVTDENIFGFDQFEIDSELDTEFTERLNYAHIIRKCIVSANLYPVVYLIDNGCDIIKYDTLNDWYREAGIISLMQYIQWYIFINLQIKQGTYYDKCPVKMHSNIRQLRCDYDYYYPDRVHLEILRNYFDHEINELNTRELLKSLFRCLYQLDFLYTRAGHSIDWEYYIRHAIEIW
jgi:hypothetical protein